MKQITTVCIIVKMDMNLHVFGKCEHQECKEIPEVQENSSFVQCINTNLCQIRQPVVTQTEIPFSDLRVFCILNNIKHSTPMPNSAGN